MTRDGSNSKHIYASGADGTQAHADRVYIQNSQQLAIESRMLMGAGLIHGWSGINLFGHNPTLATAFGDLWDAAAVNREDFVSGSGLFISSDNVADTQQMVIEGINGSSGLQSTIVTMSGQTKVTVPGTWLEVWHTHNVDTSGFLGDVNIYTDSAVTTGVPDDTGSVKLYAPADHQLGQVPYFMVPSGKIGMLCCANMWGAGGKSVEAVFETRTNDGVWFRMFDVEALNPATTWTLSAPPRFEAGDRFRIRAKVDSTTAAVSCGFSIILKDTQDINNE